MKTKIDNKHWLLSKPIAHRGLWGKNIIENSITAYLNATEHGYPIEIDLYLTTDDQVVCFHDLSLKRMTGIDGLITKKSLAELKSYPLIDAFGNQSQERIPLLKEVLTAVDERVPLLLEIKNQSNKKIVEKVLEALKDYNGEYALQSFNPLFLRKIKKLAPKVLRGILSSKIVEGESFINTLVVKTMALNFLCSPQFISYDYQCLPVKKRKAKNLPIIAWTLTDKKSADFAKKYADNIIYENFIP